ncbi:MAG TPA: T9SS type A sorting domain-containing protein, partial [Niastella sp.]|nr:T9SS type A sorting domain-containing protein [Niastella sp.]
GYTFYSAMPFTSGNIYNYSVPVTQSGVYYAYFNSGAGCIDTITIRVYINACPDIDDDNDGLPDYLEGNNALAFGDHDSDGMPNYSDAQYPGFIDNNGDGINDNFDPSADADNDGIPNFMDTSFPGFTDANGDGINDAVDADLDGIPNHLDLDSDNDGIPDVTESFGVDANGDGRIDNYSDTDNDGFSQNVDGNTTGMVGSGNGLGAMDTDGDGVPNYLDLDSDNDGIPDVIEVNGLDANNDGRIDSYTDTDGDGLSDNADGDTGNDGVAENATNALLRTGTDTNNDGRADSFPYKNMDTDSKPNPYDLDSDGDGITDVREAGFGDSNADGKIDGSINSYGWSTTVAALSSLALPNTDGSGAANYLDIDADNDGIPDNIEGQLTNFYSLPSGSDTDGDGIDNTYDATVGFGGAGINPVNTDGDGMPDYIDADADGDGVTDIIEGNDFNFNGVADDMVTLTGLDTDNDGLDNRFDTDNSSSKGTSAYMGTNGSITGPALYGSSTVVQKTTAGAYDRDWRYIGSVLNIYFVNLTGTGFQNKVTLNWTAQVSDEVHEYIVERSVNGTDFSPVQTVSGKAGIQNYLAIDKPDAGNISKLFYRIKVMRNNGGLVLYSRIVIITLLSDNAGQLQVFPNPAYKNMQLTYTSTVSGSARFSVMNTAGTVLATFNETVYKGLNRINVSRINNLPDGVYYIQASCGGKQQQASFQIRK